MYGFTNWETQGIFVLYDPYQSFADDEIGVKERTFISKDGRVTRGAYSNIWRVGRESYKDLSASLGYQPKIEHLNMMAGEILQQEEFIAPYIQSWIDSGALTILETIDGEPIKNVVEYISSPDYCEGWLIEIEMRIFKDMIARKEIDPGKLPSYSNWLNAIVILWMDDAIIASDLNQPDSMALTIVNTSRAAAVLYREVLETARLAISSQAKKSVAERHKKTREVRDRIIQEWTETKLDYNSRADFVRIIGRKENIKERTLDGWIAAYEKTKP